MMGALFLANLRMRSTDVAAAAAAPAAAAASAAAVAAVAALMWPRLRRRCVIGAMFQADSTMRCKSMYVSAIIRGGQEDEIARWRPSTAQNGALLEWTPFKQIDNKGRIWRQWRCRRDFGCCRVRSDSRR